MTMALSAETTDGPQRSNERLIPLKVKLGAAAIALATFGLVCYGIGTNHGGSGTHVLTGQAYVAGSGQAAVIVDGWAYGFEVSPNGMTWYDASGERHDGGIPPCLQHSGDAHIRFAYANAAGPTGQDSWRVVTWTQCINPTE